MRYGIISDIHSNLEAMESVIHAFKEQHIQSLFCLGDLVGYGANPLPCLKMIQELNIISVAGNHDWAVSGKFDFTNFNPAAQEAVLWTRSQLTSEHKQFLNNLDLIYQNDSFILVHGTLNQPEFFYYLFSNEDSMETFHLMDRSVCFVGHTHIPQIFIKREENIIQWPLKEVDVDQKNKYIVNVGSVGQPRDGNPMAAYCIFDTVLKKIEIKRIRYDVNKARLKILRAGLPQSLAQRLAIGL